MSGLVLKFQTWLMLLCKTLSLTFQHLGCYGVRFCPLLSNMFDAMLKGLVLNFQSSWIVRCKILSLTFNHLGWHAVRPVLNFESSLVLRCQVLSPTFKHAGWYAASSRPSRTKTRTTTAKTRLRFWLRCFFPSIYWWSTSKLRRAWFIKFDIRRYDDGIRTSTS